LAQVLIHVPQMQASGLKRPIQLVLSYDKKAGCTGVIPMVHALAKDIPKAKICIVGEPSLMKVVTGHKGPIGYLTQVHGLEVHSSLIHKGASAIMNAVRLIEWHRKTPAANAAVANPDAPCEQPYTTLHVGKIRGESHAGRDARYRAFAAQHWQQRCSRPIRDTGVEIKVNINVPALEQETKGAAEQLCSRLTGDNSTHVVSYQTEAGHFQRAGFSTAICGPGSIEQTLQPNEFVTRKHFD